MKTRIVLTPLLVLALFAAGCKTDNTQKLTQANEVYVGLIQAVNTEAKAGRISHEQLNTIAPYKVSVETALDALQAVVTKDAATWDKAFADFNAAVAEFNKAKAAAEAKSTTQP